jgi:TRAP-type uncharacterized transport system substrate-binding protein
MPVKLPTRPTLAMRLWLAERLGWFDGAGSSTPGHSGGKAVSLGSLEHIVRSRARLFLRHAWLVTILGTLIIGGSVWLAFYLTNRATVITVAAGPASGFDAKLLQILNDKFARDHDKTQLELVATSDAAASARAIADRKAELAILPSTLESAPDWPVVAILRKNVMALIVPAAAENDGTGKKGKSAKGGKAAKKAKPEKTGDDDKLEKVSQLAGRRVGIVSGGAASADLLNAVLKHYGVPLDKVQISQVEPDKLAAAVREHQVDVILVAGTATGHAISDAVAAATQNDEAPGFIAIDQADGIAMRNPAFESVDIDAGTFGGNPPTPDDSLKTLGFSDYLVARRTYNQDHIAALSKLIYTSRQWLATQPGAEIKIKAPSTDKDAPLLVHPGTLAYLGDDQKSFFDKYGDDIFYGLLIFPIFGSAIAGIASYFRNDGRTRRLRLLQRALDLIRKISAASSVEALDQLQTEADNLVHSIIHHCEHEDYDQAALTSFSMALDQLHFATAARRALLRDGTGAEAKAGAKAVAA